jgi:predicted nucleotidyltransferase
MDTPVLNLSPEQIAIYRSTALRRQKEQSAQVAAVSERAWSVAKRAAQMLRGRFGVIRVVVFGSLVHEGCFTRWSDIDIAAWGIAPEDMFRAIGAAWDLDDEFDVNLVDVNACRPSLLEMIEREGIEI